MATTATERATTKDTAGTGRVVRIIGPVVDVEFAPDELPAIQNALTVERTLDDDTAVILRVLRPSGPFRDLAELAGPQLVDDFFHRPGGRLDR